MSLLERDPIEHQGHTQSAPREMSEKRESFPLPHFLLLAERFSRKVKFHAALEIWEGGTLAQAAMVQGRAQGVQLKEGGQ